MRCPVDGSECPDDLCHGSGCVQTPMGEPMLERCEACRCWMPEDEIADWGVCWECIDRDEQGWDDFDDEQEQEGSR